MPTYDYLCPNGHRFEVIHGVTADGPSACPICGASPVRKAISAPSIVFKGSGWAKKDRSTTSKPAAASAKTSEASGSSGSPSSEGSGSSSSDAGGSSEGGSTATPSGTPKPASEPSSSGSGAAAD
jgi:putative FmdB family regulatory protein